MNIQPRINDSFILCCPRCDTENLHQERTVVKFRHEDKGGTIVNADQLRSTFHAAERNEFEGRRSSLWIEFSCEGCGKNSWLGVLQNKGNTYVEWSPAQPKGLQ